MSDTEEPCALSRFGLPDGLTNETWTPIKLRPDTSVRCPVPAGWYPWRWPSADTSARFTGRTGKKDCQAECDRRNAAISSLEIMTYSDGQPLESGDRALLAEHEQRFLALRARWQRFGIEADRHDARIAFQALRSHARSILSEGCEVCDEHGEVVIGWEPATMLSPREARYGPCPECSQRVDDYLKGVGDAR